MPRRDDIRTILVIGSGPIVIGQACEFDYSGTQACKVLRREGYRVSLAGNGQQADPGDRRIGTSVLATSIGLNSPWDLLWVGDKLYIALAGHHQIWTYDPAAKEVQISKLFEWYGKDFVSDPQRPAAKPEQYLANWVGGDCKSVLASGGYTVKTIEWNWTLNEKR